MECLLCSVIEHLPNFCAVSYTSLPSTMQGSSPWTTKSILRTYSSSATSLNVRLSSDVSVFHYSMRLILQRKIHEDFSLASSESIPMLLHHVLQIFLIHDVWNIRDYFVDPFAAPNCFHPLLLECTEPISITVESLA